MTIYTVFILSRFYSIMLLLWHLVMLNVSILLWLPSPFECVSIPSSRTGVMCHSLPSTSQNIYVCIYRHIHTNTQCTHMCLHIHIRIQKERGRERHSVLLRGGHLKYFRGRGLIKEEYLLEWVTEWYQMNPSFFSFSFLITTLYKNSQSSNSIPCYVYIHCPRQKYSYEWGKQRTCLHRAKSLKKRNWNES